ncbi:ER lumen protein retaining receptor [Mytilinidion resinicola]|uniref:ER lumen protein retaining receptor n=1 Tax=Mytilinidion resinicola TaxID=574789 RepID=A0A6A6Y0D0_9PEZI|nr:ER lumen protein retaining receptor [Mytilinidion resinicola]KAF2801675.1 ER lumen protein retaining receptor [Mytilinidion resinicola]
MPGFHFNVFHILGDVSHTTSKLVLIWAIHSNSSAEGVSLITQVLYATVFLTRYLDIFHVPATGDWNHVWNFTLKIFYTLSSLYIIFLMTRVYARTREREKAWKFGVYCFLGALILAPIWFGIFHKFILGTNWFIKLTWTFSEILEATAVIPQLLLLRQTTVPTVLDSFYLVTLGAYRLFYVLNWIVRGATGDYRTPDPTSWTFGTLQTALMVDFAWVYLTRQRVKLRHGGVVDSEDLDQGWLIRRLVGRKSGDGFDEEEGADGPRDGQVGGHGAAPAAAKSWGRRGISVSADEGVLEGERQRPKPKSTDPEAQPLADPDAFEEDSDREEDLHASGVSGVSGGDEWRDEEERR